MKTYPLISTALTENQHANPLTQSRPPARREAYLTTTKRLFDILFCLAILPTVATVIGVIYLMVRASGGPGFFGHTRIGQSGKAFTCWKIRTMAPDAQDRFDHLIATDPQARDEWMHHQKLRNDPRVTRIGDFLRRSSLDELPQIWNVLRGEMSLIGPRPVTAQELDKYGTRKWAYLGMRPGISGLWQVSGRNDVSYDERVALDVAYHQKASFGFDAQILLRTVGAVLNKTGF